MNKTIQKQEGHLAIFTYEPDHQIYNSANLINSEQWYCRRRHMKSAQMAVMNSPFVEHQQQDHLLVQQELRMELTLLEGGVQHQVPLKVSSP